MRLAEENTALIEQREKEIQSIVQSISELNEIFRDLATMIVEQVSFLCLTLMYKINNYCHLLIFLIVALLSEVGSSFWKEWSMKIVCQKWSHNLNLSGNPEVQHCEVQLSWWQFRQNLACCDITILKVEVIRNDSNYFCMSTLWSLPFTLSSLLLLK